MLDPERMELDLANHSLTMRTCVCTAPMLPESPTTIKLSAFAGTLADWIVGPEPAALAEAILGAAGWELVNERVRSG